MNVLKENGLVLRKISPKLISTYKSDLLILVFLATVVAIAAYSSSFQIPNPIFTDFYAQDVWFGSDIPTVFGNITSVNSDFGRNNKHPLFPIMVFPLVFGIGKIFNLDPLSAVKVFTTFVASLWICSLYILLRLMNCRRPEAVLFSLLGAVSSASVFWLMIPESFPLGSATIILGLIFVVLTQSRSFSDRWYVAVNVMTVSVTITNAMVGIFATVVNHRWRKIFAIGVLALLVSTALWIPQRVIFENTGFPFQPGTFIGEKKFVSVPNEGGLLSVLSSFFYQTMVMPAIRLLDSPIRPDWVKLEANNLAPASGSIWGLVAVIAWTGLLCLGILGFFSTNRHPKFRIVLGLTLVAQLAMHSIYGVEETFIYSLHFIPLLLVLSAFSLFTRFRPLSLGLAFILLISAGVNNKAQFDFLTTSLWNYGTPQQQVAAQMTLRPGDPWPRNRGQVVLSVPGGSLTNKAFYAPGGSFSPSPGSFGVSIGALDSNGNLIATSDDIPIDEIQQKFFGSLNNTALGVISETEFYHASWSALGKNNWQLNVQPVGDAATTPIVFIRSVGPAGAAISSLDWNGQRLLINDRWIVKDIPKTAKVYLGSENTENWIGEESNLSSWEDPYGWGVARIELNQGNSWTLVIEDNFAGETEDYTPLEISSRLLLNLPDAQFVDSLTAQISHLLMGVIGDRVYPSDPISSPLPRFRDGAYQMVALARSGNLALAKRLSPYFAENDFFNSAVSEVDIPAVGIWALEQVAESLQESDYDQWLWPHVRRKIDIILNLLSSSRPGYPVLSSTRFPREEHRDFLQIDLIAGDMGSVPSLFSVNPNAGVMGYRALLDAAMLADRTNHSAEAALWRSQAQAVKLVWQQLGLVEASLNNGLWPSGIAEDERSVMAELLGASENEARDLDGHFRQAIATAHQWLMLNQPQQVWSTLRWLWENQSSPNLYVWAEHPSDLDAMPMPESFSQWHRLRGRVDSSQPTMHYWTTAEMALLQLDMLAYINQQEGDVQSLVIGSGIPEEWLRHSMGVKGLMVGGNIVNWTWDGQQLNVEIQGDIEDIQLGSAFPIDTQINTTFVSQSA
ncbi:hypothetical protein IQ254_18130 [Nodosilinea sp. LEGE 07088]|uniref:hypothetical protein n=1 Tax=Nodosilinea sp. LEGE 07088 TaxID=2777968 RepID=UPI0018828992|nr:hypothetical protein [Nodosilinea sp. LEGE 07088]MBE9139088.1 hypothetical protein [Nodosilinea sp. LEGE 07088]